ncbi:hypothetical protein ACSBR2_027224 [Camellia fascicularis]
MVVKVLEGSIEVENNLDYSFTTPVVRRAIRVAGHQKEAIGATTYSFISINFIRTKVKKVDFN